MLNWPVLLFCGLLIGCLTGMFGVGGGFIATPVLHVVLGLPMPLAVGTSLCQMVGTSAAALSRQNRSGHVDFKVALAMMGGSFVGVVLGVKTVEAAKSWGTLGLGAGGKTEPAVNVFLMCLFLVVLLAASAHFIRDRFDRVGSPRRHPLLGRLKFALMARFEFGSVSLVALAFMGVAIGFLTGLLGIGGGIILVPALHYLLGMSMKRAVGTSLFFVFLSSIFGTATHVVRGNVDLAVALAFLCTSTLGAQAGAQMGISLSALKLKRYFVVVLLLGAGLMAFRLVGLFFFQG